MSTFNVLRGWSDEAFDVVVVGGGPSGATAADDLDDAADDPLMRAASQAFDPRRHHLLVDANRVLELLRAVAAKAVVDAELAEVAKQWLDAASALRREGVAVTAENLLWKVTVGRR